MRTTSFVAPGWWDYTTLVEEEDNLNKVSSGMDQNSGFRSIAFSLQIRSLFPADLNIADIEFIILGIRTAQYGKRHRIE